jgi:RimJ/RimL family protein N-acetyltransferase
MVVLVTGRLRLRPFEPRDAARFAELAGAFAVARMTTDIPHPLSADQASAWVRHVAGDVRFAIERDSALIGGVGYFMKRARTAELGFWLGEAYWDQGYATEAARAVVQHGFSTGDVATFTTSHFLDNAASRRVITKLGFAAIGAEQMWSPARGAMATALIYRLENTLVRHAPIAPMPPRRGWRDVVARARSLMLG